MEAANIKGNLHPINEIEINKMWVILNGSKKHKRQLTFYNWNKNK
jgi:hypothetical protein